MVWVSGLVDVCLGFLVFSFGDCRSNSDFSSSKDMVILRTDYDSGNRQLIECDITFVTQYSRRRECVFVLFRSKDEQEEEKRM